MNRTNKRYKITKKFNLTNNDYKKILNSYNVPVPRTYIKRKTEKVMARKLCRCIKKLGTQFEPRSIGICTRTVFNRRNLTRGKFKCKRQANVTMTKKKRKPIKF